MARVWALRDGMRDFCAGLWCVCGMNVLVLVLLYHVTARLERVQDEGGRRR